MAKRMPMMSGGMEESGADGALTRRLSVICEATDTGLGISEGRNVGSLTYRLGGRRNWRLGGVWIASERPIEKSSGTKRDRGLSI